MKPELLVHDPEIIAGHEFKAVVRDIPLFRDDFGLWEMQMFEDADGAYWVISIGELARDAPILLRIDDHCMTGFDLGHKSLEGHPETACDCKQQSYESRRKIQEVGRGLVIHTPLEARGHGPVAKALQLKIQGLAILNGHEMPDTYQCFEMTGFVPPDIRDYDAVRAIIYNMGLSEKPFILLTNNPRKVDELRRHGINVVDLANVYDELQPDYYLGANFLAKVEDGHAPPPSSIPKGDVVFHSTEVVV